LDFGLWTLDFGLWTLDFGLWTTERQHRRMQLRQYVVVQHAAGAPVEHLALDHAPPLQQHQALGHLHAGLRVNQPFATGAGDLDLILREQAPSRFSPSNSAPISPRSPHRGTAHIAPP